MKWNFLPFFNFFFLFVDMDCGIVFIIVCAKGYLCKNVKSKKQIRNIIFVLKRNDISNLYFVVYVSKSIKILPKKKDNQPKPTKQRIIKNKFFIEIYMNTIIEKTTKTLISVLPGITWIVITI